MACQAPSGGAVMTTISSVPLDNLLKKLNDVREAPRGSGKFTAQCPSHTGKRNMLSVRMGHNGKVLLHCFLNCSFADILHKLRMEPGDLFEESQLIRRKKR